MFARVSLGILLGITVVLFYLFVLLACAVRKKTNTNATFFIVYGGNATIRDDTISVGFAHLR